MDLLSYFLGKKYADKEIEGIEFQEDNGDLFDRKISLGLLLNYIRQNESAWLEKGIRMDHGQVTLTNTLPFPFNSSKKSVALSASLPDTKYAVIARIASATGNPGEVEVSDKLTNGFKLNYTGSASSAVVEYIVIGGSLT